MAEPVIRLLHLVRIDESRDFVEFRFRDAVGAELPIRIDFTHVELLVSANHAIPPAAPAQLELRAA